MDVAKDFFNDRYEWCSGVNCHSRSNARFGLVQALNDFALLWSSAPVAGVNTFALIDPSHHSVDVVYFKNENTVMEVEKFRKVPAAPAEERHGRVIICDKGFDLCQIPDWREVVFRFWPTRT